MAQQVKMDWLLFWTILALTGCGLVMVYSASSMAQELRATPLAKTEPHSVDEADIEPARSPEQPPRWPMKRVGAAVAGLAALILIARRYRAGVIAMGWALAGIGAISFLQLLAYWMEADRSPHYGLLLRQAGAALLGFVLLMLIGKGDYRKLGSPRWAFAGLSVIIFLLILVYFFGRQRRWLDLGVSVQPSEFAKPALVVFLAWFVTIRSQSINHPHTVWPATLALVALAGGVVVADFGTAIVLVATAAAVFYLAGLNCRYIVGALAMGTLLLTAALIQKPHRIKRILDFVDKDYKYLSLVDPQRKLLTRLEGNTQISDTTYQATQSRIAIGAGGMWGRGLMRSRQKLLFLPEAHTDFIYAILAEEAGLWGSALILAGFLVVLWRGYALFYTAPDEFGKYLAVGVTTTLVFQALLNMSVVLDLGPTKGIPLPLISFGGSSMLSSMISLGLLLSVSKRSAA